MRYVTILREPIARWISMVRYLRYHLPQSFDPNVPLRDFAEWMLDQPPETTLELINGQTNFLAEHEWHRLNRHDAPAVDWKADPESFGRYRRERLAYAKASLAEFGAVGTAERMVEFTNLLQHRAGGWDLPLVAVDGLDYVNVNPGPLVEAAWIARSDSVVSRLIDAFAEDYELHRFANERLTADLTWGMAEKS
jgi:hypothetical protein